MSSEPWLRNELEALRDKAHRGAEADRARTP
jgi:hypothetical protein